MGIGPAVAIPAAVKSAGLELDNIDLFEINEVICRINGNCFMIKLLEILSQQLYVASTGICIPVCVLPQETQS